MCVKTTVYDFCLPRRCDEYVVAVVCIFELSCCDDVYPVDERDVFIESTNTSLPTIHPAYSALRSASMFDRTTSIT